jgi:hypothetical protein
VDFFGGNTSGFRFQNVLFRAATGIDAPVWVFEPGRALEITADDHITTQAQTMSGYCYYKCQGASGKIVYTYTIENAGLLCLDMNLPQRNSFSVYKTVMVDGNEVDSLLFTESVSLPQTFSVCDVVPGDVIKVVISCQADETSAMTIKAATVDEAVFRMGYDVLNASVWQLTDCTSTYISGTIRCDRDGLMYTSVPQDGNWIAYVDGERVEPVLVGEVMLSIPMAEGVHEVELRYENKAYEYGKFISFGCAGVFAAIVLCHWLIRRKKKEIQ